MATSQWLRHGDVIRLGSTRMVFESDSGTARLRVEHSREKNRTEPPAIGRSRAADPGGVEPEERIIHPVRFEPRWHLQAARRKRRIRRTAVLIWVVGLGLLLASWFVFTARYVRVQIEPEPDHVDIRGRLAGPAVAGRYLLRPGDYVLVAEKTGYHRLETPIEITDEPYQTLIFALEKLPGHLMIDTGRVVGARVSVDGKPVGETPLDALELSAGEHAVLVQAERYTDFTSTVSVRGGGELQRLTAKLVPNWSGVRIDSKPRGAKVRVDGKAYGTTPMSLELVEGRHDVELTLAGYKTYRGVVEVEANQALHFPRVRLEFAEGILALESNPSGATVTVNGEYSGHTPLELPLKRGKNHKFEITKAGYEAVLRQIQIEPGQTKKLNVSLPPRQGEVKISALPPDAIVYVQGVDRGPANQTLLLIAVPHEIEVRKGGYESYRTTLTPRPGFPQTIEVTLKTAAQLAAEATPRLIHSAQGHELVLVDGGRFRMGAPRREPGRRANEKLREVEVTRPFYIATREVSNREFREFKNPHLSGKVGDRSLETDHHPVVRVDWEEAARFCNWLSAKDSLPPAYQQIGGRVAGLKLLTTGYRLPTEAEWAWAARFQGTATPVKYPWGNKLPVPAGGGNYGDESGRPILSNWIQGYDDGYPVTAPVDSFEPNSLGLYHLGDNVAEWVHDVYSVALTAGGAVERDPVGPSEGELHVIRGSSWMDSSVSELRLTYRDYGKAPRPDVGFRIARYLR